MRVKQGLSYNVVTSTLVFPVCIERKDIEEHSIKELKEFLEKMLEIARISIMTKIEEIKDGKGGGV